MGADRISKADATDRVVLDLLAEHDAAGTIPTNGRFVFYELEQRGLAVKPDPDDTRKNRRRSIGWPPGQQDITDSLTRLRGAGSVPWAWIIDEGRNVAAWVYAATVADYISNRLDEACINPWDGEPPLILCESRATAGVLERAAATYVCPIAGTGGQSAGFLHTDVAPLLVDNDREVLYLGDLDRCGNDIEANTLRVLTNTTDREINWTRLAMTEDQVAEYGIQPIWKVDGRDRVGREAVEVEALGQAGVVALVSDVLEARCPQSLASVREREERERAAVRQLLEAGAA